MQQNRCHARLNFEEPIELLFDNAPQHGTTRNISHGGIFIITNPLPEYGEKCILKIQLPGVKEISEISCIVRWKKGNGIGLQFENLRAIEVWALSKLINTLQ